LDSGTKYVKEFVLFTEYGGVYAMNEEGGEWVPLPPVPGSYFHAVVLREEREGG
jgi:hypothetical protein